MKKDYALQSNALNFTYSVWLAQKTIFFHRKNLENDGQLEASFVIGNGKEIPYRAFL